MGEGNDEQQQKQQQERAAAAAQGGGERLAQVQLAALAEASEAADTGGSLMSETQRAALMSSLSRKEESKQRCSSSTQHVNPKAVKELQELLLLPAAAAEAALRQSGGDVQAAVRHLVLIGDHSGS